MRRAGFVLSVLVLVAVPACSSKITPFGPGHVVQLEPEEQRLWDQSRGEMDALQASGLRHRDDRLQTYVESVLLRLLSDNERAYFPLKPRIVIIDVPLANASVYPSGDILIHTALLGRMRNEAQLAMLLGHELTHATHRHAHRQRTKSYAASGAITYAAMLSSIVSGKLATGIEKVGGLITRAAIEGYGRDLERESDRVGLTLVAQAGYDPQIAARMFERMLAASEKPDSNHNTLLFYASHPKMTQRVQDCRKLAKTLDPELLSAAVDVGEDRYVAVCNELIFEEAERHVTQGKFQLVTETVQFLERTLPADPRTFILAGDVARTQGDHAAARTAYEAALARSPAAAGAHRGLGLVAAKTGDKATAIRHLRRYLQLAPGAADRAYIESYARQLASE